MPKVGGKSFPYTKKGIADAKAYGKKDRDKDKDKKKKRPGVSDEQIKPRPIKPTPGRRKFLDELNEMNKRGGM